MGSTEQMLSGDVEGVYRDAPDPWGCEAGKSSLNNRLFLEMLAEFQPKRIVDVGCGLGGLSSEMKKRFECDVIGLDVSREAISKARALHPEVWFECLDFRRDECDWQADIVTMSEVLWFVLGHLDGVIEKVKRMAPVFASHQYFPSEQRFGRSVIDGEAGYVAFLKKHFAESHRASMTVPDGTVLLSTWRTK